MSVSKSVSVSPSSYLTWLPPPSAVITVPLKIFGPSPTVKSFRISRPTNPTLFGVSPASLFVFQRSMSPGVMSFFPTSSS